MGAAKNTSGAVELENLELSRVMYDNIANKMYSIAGVNLPYSPKNEALIRNRIVKVMRRRGIASYEDYWEIVSKNLKSDIDEFVSALTTNMTSFFRESSHFDFLRKEIPLIAKKFGDVRVWCSASSTGQEPYTIAMTLADGLNGNISRVKVLATDIDLRVLKEAAIGIYEERDIQGLDKQHEEQYFEKFTRDGLNYVRVKDQLHRMLTFAPFNLMEQKYKFNNKFHIIFCRNVLIYFDEETTKRVIDNLVSCLEKDGYLILGHSESGNIKHPHLKPLTRAVYQKV